MPFDMTPDVNERLRTNVIARLELLQELAAQTQGNQEDWRTCLWSEVRQHGALMTAGGKQLACTAGGGPTSYRAAANWFGFARTEIWNTGPLGYKRSLIAAKLAELKAAAGLKAEQVSVG